MGRDPAYLLRYWSSPFDVEAAVVVEGGQAMELKLWSLVLDARFHCPL